MITKSSSPWPTQQDSLKAWVFWQSKLQRYFWAVTFEHLPRNQSLCLGIFFAQSLHCWLSFTAKSQTSLWTYLSPQSSISKHHKLASANFLPKSSQSYCTHPCGFFHKLNLLFSKLWTDPHTRKGYPNFQ